MAQFYVQNPTPTQQVLQNLNQQILSASVITQNFKCILEKSRSMIIFLGVSMGLILWWIYLPSIFALVIAIWTPIVHYIVDPFLLLIKQIFMLQLSTIIESLSLVSLAMAMSSTSALFALPIIAAPVIILSSLCALPLLIAKFHPPLVTYFYSIYQSYRHCPPELSPKEYRELIYAVHAYCNASGMDYLCLTDPFVTDLEERKLYNIIHILIKLGANRNDFPQFAEAESFYLIRYLEHIAAGYDNSGTAIRDSISSRAKLFLPDKFEDNDKQGPANLFVNTWNLFRSIREANETTPVAEAAHLSRFSPGTI